MDGPRLPTCYTCSVDIIKHLLPEDLDKTVNEKFEKFDYNQDGNLDRKETVDAINDIFSSFGKEYEMNQRDADYFFDSMDENKDGLLQIEEFRRLYIGFYLHTFKQREMQEMGLPY